MTLLLSASLVNCFQIVTMLLTGLLRWENFTSILGFFLSHKISYEVAWFTVSSFRRTPICFSSEKHFKCEFKISDSLFHQSLNDMLYPSCTLVEHKTHNPFIEGSNLTTSTRGLFYKPGNTKGGSITVPLTSCLTGLH